MTISKMYGTAVIKFHFDAEKNSIFYEFELSKILKHPVVF